MSTPCRRSVQTVAAAFGMAGLVFLAMLFFSPALVDAQAQVEAPVSAGAKGGVKTVTFEQRLTFGLQVRRPSERAFIQSVVDTVNRGDLPKRLVDRTFFWARSRTSRQINRRPHRPIIYFQPALTIQAKRLGIEIRQDRPSATS